MRLIAVMPAAMSRAKRSCSSRVGSPNRRTETERYVVGKRDRIVDILDLEHHRNGAEHFSLATSA